ncbi:flp pilus-assembly TadE/G-like family protein [Bifidobacterium sp. LC6]|uniref:Flp pilus-assembly TadE/G-like family protein n=1 Tax=Bifidobacterium colobi TaxID=2809026 RepID=A0ABS5UUV1_9BIFI|nr:Rv3654c family TadE-like protein [Bifidobacterium colobi]MBT1174223.1 flp pilus-assembly TadE/G-like family protein [Bifidobacterium colobi]
MRNRCEEGSGTMAGAILVMLAALALAVVAAVGNLLICQQRARSVADAAAFNAAYAWWQASTEDPCALANDVAMAQQVTLVECVMVGDDVRLSVAKDTQVPGIGQVVKEARAGPVDCE